MAAIDYGTGPNTQTGDLMPAALTKLQQRLIARGFDPGALGSDIASALAKIEVALRAAEAAYVPPITNVLSIVGTPSAAVVGTAYSFTPIISYFSGTPVFALTGTLPAGLTFNTATGAITGMPTAVAASVPLTITVTDAKTSAQLSISLAVGSAPVALSISGTPAAAVVGQGATFTPTISGGTAPYVVSLASGTLPAGRTLANNSITGTYTTAGAFNYTLRATDAAGATADLPVSGTVTSAAAVVNLTMTQLADTRMFQRATTTGSANNLGAGSIPLAITIDQAATVEYRLRDAVASGNPTVQDWTSAGSVASGATAVSCPNVPARLGWYYVDLRANGGTPVLGTARVGMGRIVAIAGPSQAHRFLAKMTNYTGSNASLGVNISPFGSVYALYYESTKNNGSTPTWALPSDAGPYDGTGVSEFLSKEIAAFGVNCAVTGYGYGGATIAQFQPGAVYNVTLRSILDTVGGFEAAWWVHGGNDMNNNLTAASVIASTKAIFDDLPAHNAVRGSSFAKYNTATGTRTSAGSGTADVVQRYRKAASDYAAANGSIYFEPHDNTVYTDGVHQDMAGNIVWARHLYRATRAELGLSADVGPSIASATRAAGSTNIVLTTNLPSGATALTSLGNPATRFTVFPTGTQANALALDSTTPITVSGSTITLKLAADPGNVAVDVYSFFHPDPTSDGSADIIRDNRTDGDGITLGRQLAPSLVPIVAAAPGAVANSPVNSAAPTVSGTPQVGQTLTTTNGTWSNSPTSYSYQWKSGTNNVGTNQNTYVPVASDVGSTITCTVTATNANGSASATSAATSAVTAATQLLDNMTIENGHTTLVTHVADSGHTYSVPNANAGAATLTSEGMAYWTTAGALVASPAPASADYNVVAEYVFKSDVAATNIYAVARLQDGNNFINGGRFSGKWQIVVNATVGGTNLSYFYPNNGSGETTSGNANGTATPVPVAGDRWVLRLNVTGNTYTLFVSINAGTETQVVQVVNPTPAPQVAAKGLVGARNSGTIGTATTGVQLDKLYTA